MAGARRWEAIVWHHSEAADGVTYDWPAIRRYHILGKGWSDIGYHFGIERVSGALQVNVGRKLSMIGGHCLGQNHRAIGICVVGNFDKAAPDDETVKFAVDLAKEIMAAFPLIKPENNHYHREFTDKKTCPGNLFPPLAEFRGMLV